MTDQPPLPDDLGSAAWDEWRKLVQSGKRPDQETVPISNEALEHLIHPFAERFIGTFDERSQRLDSALPRSIVQFCHCLSQVVTGRLMTLEAIVQLPVEVYAALAYSGIAGWLASEAYRAGSLSLPNGEVDPNDTRDLL